jgi:hypothetical protein
VVHKIDSDNDEKLHRVMHAFQEEVEYARQVREQDG